LSVRWGVTLPLPGLSLAAHRPLLERLTDLGYSDVWTGEGGGHDGFTPLAAAAAWAPGLRVGTGIVPVQTRGPGVLAQTAATLAQLGGEVVLGIGSSVPAHVTALNGMTHDRPFARVRDTLQFLRRALDGEYVSESYETFEVDGFQLREQLPHRPKVIVGALRPGMLRLAFRAGDGAMTNVLAADDVPAVVNAAGPQAHGQELVVKIFVSPTTDATFARTEARDFLSWILNQPPYVAFHDWLGRGDRLRASRERWEAGDRVGAAQALTDEVVDELWVHGSLDECCERIADHVRPGVTTVVLHLSPTPELLASRDPVRALADVLRALRS
jgi:probable F420-dependent oxidoreductase